MNVSLKLHVLDGDLNLSNLFFLSSALRFDSLSYVLYVELVDDSLLKIDELLCCHGHLRSKLLSYLTPLASLISLLVLEFDEAA